MSAIVIFYSRTGNTSFVAETIANISGAELQPLIDKKKRSGFLGWLISGRDALLNYKTEIEDIKLDLRKYDTVFLGCPNWAANLPPAMRTFLEKANLSKKRVALFCTQDSMGAERVFNGLRLLTQGAEIISEKYFNKVLKNKADSLERIKAWVETLKLSE